LLSIGQYNKEIETNSQSKGAEVKKLDPGQAIADITSLCTEFGPILERSCQELLRLQQQSSGAMLEDTWALRQESGKAEEQIRVRIGRMFGSGILKEDTLDRVLRRYLKGRPDLIQSIQAIRQGFPKACL
jgi:hypothetical protein